MVWLVKMIQVYAAVVCVLNKGVTSNVTLVLLYCWSDMGWIQNFFTSFN